MSLAEHLVTTYQLKIKTLTLEPSLGGVFDVWINGALAYSKRESGRFPEHGEIDVEMEERLAVESGQA